MTSLAENKDLMVFTEGKEQLAEVAVKLGSNQCAIQPTRVLHQMAVNLTWQVPMARGTQYPGLPQVG